MSHPILSPKKLIEVALPLDAINVEAAREKSIRHGHPSTLHLWWARRPLAAARAVIFAQLVNDPASLWEAQNPGKQPSQQQRGGFTQRRDYLFRLISELVKWENTTNEEILGKAREEIRKSWREVCELNKAHPDAATLFNPDEMPGLHDPFAGGGTIPLEAQRLGLKAYASDLNPVAVLINKAMIEIPPKFAGMPPVHPDPEGLVRQKTWKGAQGLAEDVRYYGQWMRDEAFKRIGHLYPPAKVTAEVAEGRPDLEPYVGKELTVIAWLWARTVKSPNPAFSHVDVPLVSSFVLATKPGKEAWVEPIVEGDSYRFEVRRGVPPEQAKEGTKAGGRGADFRCVLSGAAIGGDYIKAEGQAGRMGAKLMAIVGEGNRERVYLSPIVEHERIALSATPEWKPDVEFFQQALGFRVGNYGMTKWSDLFTGRQLATLSALAALTKEIPDQVMRDRVTAALERPNQPQIDHNDRIDHSDSGYSTAVELYEGLFASKLSVFLNTLSRWRSGEGKSAPAFGRQAIAMVWDFAEINPFAGAAGDIQGVAEGGSRALATFPARLAGHSIQAPAQAQDLSQGCYISTDPPYYDNVGYADLSDFFYVWLRRSLRQAFPLLFATVATPKDAELVATPHRHGGQLQAESFFLKEMTLAIERLGYQSNTTAPITIYYAFKQAETTSGEGTTSTGWITFLEALQSAGLSLSGTWPMQTEGATRMRGMGSNALASSIVLVCRKRPDDAQVIGRREFIRELNATLPAALDEMTRGIDGGASPVAPVDLSQAIIGPGMAIFSRYKAVLEADGTPMSVKTALQLINRFLAEDDFDADTQFCLHWFEQNGWQDGLFGEADVLARAKATSVGGLDSAGVLISGSGKVRLRRWVEYPADWDPKHDKRLPVWEALHQLIRVFRQQGETGAGQLLASSPVRSKGEAVRQLAYRLYTLCERRGWAEDARAYNELVTSWSPIEAVAGAIPEVDPQLKLFGGA